MRTHPLGALSARDTEILAALVHRLRVFSTKQIDRTWWPSVEHGGKAALKRLHELERSGWVHVFSVLARPELPLEQPVAVWEPGDQPPSFGHVSYQLKSRWKEPARLTRCVIASQTAGRHLGGVGGRRPREKEQTHDIHVAAVFLALRSRFPEAVQYWVSEAKLLRSRGERKEKLPDALLDCPWGQRVIEFGGAYSKAKLEGFHEYCSENALPYEIW